MLELQASNSRVSGSVAHKDARRAPTVSVTSEVCSDPTLIPGARRFSQSAALHAGRVGTGGYPRGCGPPARPPGSRGSTWDGCKLSKASPCYEEDLHSIVAAGGTLFQ